MITRSYRMDSLWVFRSFELFSSSDSTTDFGEWPFLINWTVDLLVGCLDSRPTCIRHWKRLYAFRHSDYCVHFSEQLWLSLVSLVVPYTQPHIAHPEVWSVRRWTWYLWCSLRCPFQITSGARTSGRMSRLRLWWSSCTGSRAYIHSIVHILYVYLFACSYFYNIFT